MKQNNLFNSQTTGLFMQPKGPYVLWLAIVAISYFLGAKLSLLLSLPPTNASPLWMPAGIALTAVLLCGSRMWPAIFIGYLFSALDFNNLSSDTVLPALNLGIGAVIQALLAAYLIRRFVGFPTALDSDRDTILFLTLGGPIGSLFSTTYAHISFVVFGSMPLSDAWLSWLTWGIGDTIGVLLFTPFLLVLFSREHTVWRKRRATLTIPLIAVSAVAIITFYISTDKDLTRIQGQFDEGIASLHHDLQKNFDDSDLILESIARYTQTNDNLELEKFEQFVTPYLQQNNWIRSIVWATKTKQKEITTLINKKPVTKAIYTYPISMSVPSAQLNYAENKNLYDIASLSDAIDLAVSSGFIATSKVIRSGSGNKDLALLQAVYEKDMQTVRGFVLLHINPIEFITTAVKPYNSDVTHISIIDNEGTEIIHLFDNQSVKTKDQNYPIKARHIALYAGSRTLRLEMAPTDNYMSSNRHGLSWIILLVSLCFAAMMGGFLLILTGRNSHISNLVKQRTQDLFESNKSLKNEISIKEEIQAQLESIAHYDPLTGLVNRSMFQESLRQAIARNERKHTPFALLFMDLDRFKAVNDTFGHSGGDILLQETARRIQECVRNDDIVARLGGDEFVVIADNIAHKTDTARLAQKIIESLSQPFDIQNKSHKTSTSIGIAICPDNGVDAEMLIMHADTAMYRAKQAGLGNYRFYTDNMQIEALDKLSIEKDLAEAIQLKDFQLVFQPICSFKTGKVHSVEALLRWHHTTRGDVSPEDFIPIVEDIGLINELGKWVLNEACRVAKRLQPCHIQVAVNLSTMQLQNSNFSDDLFAILKQHDLSPYCLDLELTESVMMKNPEKIGSLLQPLRDKGINIAVDDFGTGYSSLSYLRSLPIDSLKIDKSFVLDLKNDSNSGAIIRAILALAQELELDVIAEGVETLSQAEILRDAGCDFAQGFYISRGISEDDLFYELDRPEPIALRY